MRWRRGDRAALFRGCDESRAEEDRRIELVGDRRQLLIPGMNRQLAAFVTARRLELIGAGSDEHSAGCLSFDRGQKMQLSGEVEAENVALEHERIEIDRST